VHRLDRICGNKPAKLLDSKSLTLKFGASRFGPVYLYFTATEAVPNPAILFLVAALMGRMGADLVFHTFFMSLLLKSVTEFNFKKTN
jgi:hypothetical protein